MTNSLALGDIEKILQRSPFLRFLGLSVIALDHEKNEITLRMRMRPEFERQPESGQFHGGVIAALIDTAGDYALVMQLGNTVPTINFRTDFLRPAIGDTLTAVAHIRQLGRRIGVVDVDVHDDLHKLVAVGRGCYSITIEDAIASKNKLGDRK